MDRSVRDAREACPKKRVGHEECRKANPRDSLKRNRMRVFYFILALDRNDDLAADTSASFAN